MSLCWAHIRAYMRGYWTKQWKSVLSDRPRTPLCGGYALIHAFFSFNFIHLSASLLPSFFPSCCYNFSPYAAWCRIEGRRKRETTFFCVFVFYKCTFSYKKTHTHTHWTAHERAVDMVFAAFMCYSWIPIVMRCLCKRKKQQNKPLQTERCLLLLYWAAPAPVFFSSFSLTVSLAPAPLSLSPFH